MFKEKRNFKILAIVAALAYMYYLAFHFRITASAIISGILAVFLFLSIAAFLYYLAYRWIYPELQKTKLHRIILDLIASFLLGISGSIWFVQNKALPAWLLNKANAIFPFVLDEKPISVYHNYFPFINFIVLTIAAAIVFFLCLQVLSRIKASFIFSFRKRLLLSSYAIMLVCVTTCVYSTDFLQIGIGQESTIWYGGTEDYVNYRIENESLTFLEDLRENGGFQYGYNYNQKLNVYISSTGFYTSLLKFGQTLTKLPPDDVLKGTRVLCSLLTAAFLTAVSLRLKKKIGLLASLLFSALSLITYWLLGPASHLIWFFPTMFISFSIGIFLYPRVMKEKLTFKRFLLIALIGYFFLFLRSYAYAPVMVLSGAIPVFFYEIYHREHWKTILWRCVQICLIGLLGFILVMGFHFVQLWFYFGTVSEAADLLINKAIFRGTGGDTNLQTPMDIFNQWMTVRVFYLSKHLFGVFPQWREPFGRINTFKTLHLLTFAAVIYALLLSWLSKLRYTVRWLTEDQRQIVFAFSMTTLAAMLSSWSWFPALGHMSHHYHMNGIMYMIPFGLTAFMLFGILVEYSIQLLIKPKK